MSVNMDEINEELLKPLEPPTRRVELERWAVDALGQRTLGSVETLDGRMCACVTQENPVGNCLVRNQARRDVAQHIVECHNALLGVQNPEQAISEVRDTLFELLAEFKLLNQARLTHEEKVRQQHVERALSLLGAACAKPKQS